MNEWTDGRTAGGTDTETRERDLLPSSLYAQVVALVFFTAQNGGLKRFEKLHVTTGQHRVPYIRTWIPARKDARTQGRTDARTKLPRNHTFLPISSPMLLPVATSSNGPLHVEYNIRSFMEHLYPGIEYTKTEIKWKQQQVIYRSSFNQMAGGSKPALYSGICGGICRLTVLITPHSPTRIRDG